MVNFTCPHCGQRASREDLSEADVEYVDLGNGLPDAVFPVIPPGDERHIDQRLCCADCYARAGLVPEKLGQPHPYHVDTHQLRLAAVDALASSDPNNQLARNSPRLKRVGLSVKVS